MCEPLAEGTDYTNVCIKHTWREENAYIELVKIGGVHKEALIVLEKLFNYNINLIFTKFVTPNFKFVFVFLYLVLKNKRRKERQAVLLLPFF